MTTAVVEPKKPTKAESNGTKKPRKSSYPEMYDFTKVGDVKTLMVTRAGKKKKVAKQLGELIQFIKNNRITKISRVKLLEKLETLKKDEKNKEKYPQLFKSVQTMTSVFNYYWKHLGQMKQIGVIGS